MRRMKECVLHKYNFEKPLAVAVSGGADSMFAILTLHNLDPTAIALTVNHNLRSGSKKEAEQVHHWLTSKGIQHHILNWEHEKIYSKIQEQAREARYQLMSNWCINNNIKTLVTAHHALDQWETFMMRLKRGSGLRGLCGISPQKKMPFGTLCRPFLDTHPDVFRKWLKENNYPWIEDPSNEDNKFERIRWRKNYPFFQEHGLSLENVSRSSHHIGEAYDYLTEEVEKAMLNVFRDPVLDISCLKSMPIYLAKCTLQRILQNVSQKKYPASWLQITRIFEHIDFPQTGGGCVLSPKKENIIIQKDLRII